MSLQQAQTADFRRKTMHDEAHAIEVLTSSDAPADVHATATATLQSILTCVLRLQKLLLRLSQPPRVRRQQLLRCIGAAGHTGKHAWVGNRPTVTIAVLKQIDLLLLTRAGVGATVKDRLERLVTMSRASMVSVHTIAKTACKDCMEMGCSVHPAAARSGDLPHPWPCAARSCRPRRRAGAGRQPPSARTPPRHPAASASPPAAPAAPPPSALQACEVCQAARLIRRPSSNGLLLEVQEMVYNKPT